MTDLANSVACFAMLLGIVGAAKVEATIEQKKTLSIIRFIFFDLLIPIQK